MVGLGEGEVGASAADLARAHGADAWRLAVVAGADPAAATRAALHSLVIGAVEGGEAAARPAVLALARTWALSSPGQDRNAFGDGLVAEAFWALEEPLRATLWCTDRLGLEANDARRVTGAAGARAAAVARGRIRRAVCRQRRLDDPDSGGPGGGCAAVAGLLSPVTAGRAPSAKVRRLRQHAAACAACADLLAGLADPTAVVEARLPAPDLTGPAQRAWREHVGAPRRPWAERGHRWAAAATSHHRPVAAALAVVTAGSFSVAAGRLATWPAPAPPPVAVAAPMATPAVPAVARRAAPTFRQEVIPPLADEVVLDPSLAHVVTPDLIRVAPPPPPVPPPPVAPQPAPEAAIGEPPPAVGQATTVDLALPVLLPVGVEVGPRCATITLGPLRVTLPCAG